jgi:hypothetical protein
MGKWVSQLVTWTVIFCGLFSKVHGQALLSLPFGLHWGDSPEKLITWATAQTMNVSISLSADQPTLRVLKIIPAKGHLPDSKASAMEGRFLSGKLYEVTVHYADTSEAVEQTEVHFETLRRSLTQEGGPLLTNQQRRTVEDQFVTRTQSFHREPVKGLFLLLAYTEVEDLLRKSKSAEYSVLYRNDNYKNEILAELKKDS